MCKFFYKWLVETKSNRYQENIMSAINTIEKFGEWHTVEKKIGSVTIADDYNFKRVKDNKVVYDIFRENLHIHVSVSPTEEIYSVRVKNPNDFWTFKYDGDKSEPDYGHPTNEYYEVYIWYLVPVLDITTSEGFIYKHGTWDKYVLRKMNSFFGEIRMETNTSRFNSYYK